MVFFRLALIGNIFMLTTCFNRIKNYRFFYCGDILQFLCGLFILPSLSTFPDKVFNEVSCLFKFVSQYFFITFSGIQDTKGYRNTLGIRYPAAIVDIQKQKGAYLLLVESCLKRNPIHRKEKNQNFKISNKYMKYYSNSRIFNFIRNCRYICFLRSIRQELCEIKGWLTFCKQFDKGTAKTKFIIKFLVNKQC